MTSVCLDGYNLALSQGSGIATYGRNLNLALREMGLETQALYGPALKPGAIADLDEIALNDVGPTRFKAGWRRSLATAASRWGVKALPLRRASNPVWPTDDGRALPLDTIWASPDLYNLSNRAFRHYGTFTPVTFGSGAKAPKVVHWTSPLPIRAVGSLNVYTFHDLIPLRLPHTTLDDKEAFLKLSRRIVETADRIVVVSEHTKRDLVELLGADENRIFNTYQASALDATTLTRPQGVVETEIKGVFGLEWKEYFLFFGAIEPKKNLGRLVQAYLASGVSTPLIIVGGRSWLDGPETVLLKNALGDGADRGGADIRRFDYLPQSLLASLVRGAKATLFPSLYEGFGLPVVEAMQMSTAVLTSTAASLPEVAGDNALMVDPYDVHAIRDAIVRLDHDVALRQKLEAAGPTQASRFSPEAYQTRLTALYRDMGISV